MEYINTKDPLEYNYIDIRNYKNFEIIPYYYSDLDYENIPFNILLNLLRYIPIELISIIWNICCIQNDYYYKLYMEYILRDNSHKILYCLTTTQMKLRSSRVVFKNQNLWCIMYNELANFLMQDNYININFCKFIIKWYDYIKIYESKNNINDQNLDSLKYSSFINIKINKCVTYINERKNDKSNILWKNSRQKNNIINIILEIQYYINRYNCISSEHPCENCYTLDLYIHNKIKYKNLKNKVIEIINNYNNFPADHF
tara:strand:- start:41 stop:814 length:774 start_codon:yes stop_codon:yes gene_type:complete